MNYLRREIKTRRILVKPSFQDFDRINVMHVTYEQFTRALTKLGLNMPAICFKILARKYMDKNNAREINYDRFLKEVDYEHLQSGLARIGVQGLGTSQVQGGLGLEPGFTTDTAVGANAMPSMGGDVSRRGPGNTVNVSVAENKNKGRFDGQARDHTDIYAMDQESDNAKNKDKLTALGNSQLKVASGY